VDAACVTPLKAVSALDGISFPTKYWCVASRPALGGQPSPPPHPRGYRWTSPPCSRTQGSVSIVLFCGVTHVLPIPKSSCCGGQTGGLLSLLHDSCLWHSRLDKPQGLKQFMSRYQLERRFHSCRGLPLKTKLDLGVREVHKPVQLVSAINNRDHLKTATTRPVLHNIA